MEKNIEKILKQEKLDLDSQKETIFKIIPELKAEDGFDHKHPHHCYDVWKHTAFAVEHSKPDLEIRLVLLLHDIGKPFSYQEDGEIRHFHGHPKKSAQMSKEILERLGISDDKIREMCYLIVNHDNVIDVQNLKPSDIELAKKQLYIQYCDAYAHNPKYVDKRIKKLDEIKEQIKQLSKTIENQEQEK